MPHLTVSQKWGQQGTLVLNRKIGVLPLSFPWGLYGVIPIRFLNTDIL